MNEWTDTSLRYRHWRMCFERLLQAFARWQLCQILFDIAAQPILECRWIDSYTQLSLRTQFKVATVYSIHTQSLSWCSTGLVPNVLPRRDEGSGKPCAVDRASKNIGTHSGLEPGTSGSRVQSSDHYTTAAQDINLNLSIPVRNQGCQLPMEKSRDIIEVDQWVSRRKFFFKIFLADLEKTTSEVYSIVQR